MQLKAKKAFPFAGRSLTVNESFEATAREGETLIAVGYAELDEGTSDAGYTTRVVNVDSEAEYVKERRMRGPDKKPRKNRYKRRDMVAE